MSFLAEVIIHSIETGSQPISDWGWDLLNAVLGAAIGSGVTIWSVYLTFRKDRKKERKDKEQFQIEKVRYFQSLVKSVLIKLKPQIEYYQDIYKKIIQNPLVLPSLDLEQLNDLERLVHKVNQEDYYHAYLGQFGVSEESIKEFRRIYMALDFFESETNLIIEIYRRATDLDHERKVKLAITVEKAKDLVALMGLNPTLANKSELFEATRKVIDDYHKGCKDYDDLTYLNTEFSIKMRDVLVNSGVNVKEIHDPLIELKNSVHLFEDIEAQNLHTANSFKEWHESLSDVLKKIEGYSARLMMYNIYKA